MSSYVQYIGNGSTTTYSVTFPYIARAHIVVSVDGIVKLSPSDFEWLSDASINFRSAPGGTVTIRRITERTTPLVDFQNGSVLTEDELNTAHLQNFYITQELQDALDGYINGGVAFYTSGSLEGSTVQDRIDAAAAEILDSALLATLNSRIADITNNGESIIATNVALDGLQTQVDTLDAASGGVGTLVSDEVTARIAGDTAMVDTVSLIGAKSGDNTAFIANLNTLRVGPTESLATRLTALSSADGSNTAAIVAEQVTRANADSALSSSITTLQSLVNGNAAAIVSEQTARANGDSANASSITTLQTTVGGHTTSISTQASSIDGINAKYTVKIDNNGYMSGYGLISSANNGTPTSEFIVLADKFAVVTPGTAPKVPFVITGGVCYMQNVVIQDALIANLTVGKLTTGTLTATVTQNADWNVGTGRIIWDNGVYMKVSGVGFGSSNQFIEWFGPKMSITSCTEANAISYLTTSGGAYFGGTLSAGILSNTGQTTDTSATAEITVGAFSTNGGTKTITLSYNYAYTYKCATGTGALTGSTGAATILLERSIGGGAWTTIATLNATQTQREVIVDGEPGIQDIVQFRIGGSTTVTDNSAATSDMRLRGRLTSRTLATYGGTSKTNIVNTQNVSVISNE